MSRSLLAVMLLMFGALAPEAARAGWVAEWTNVAIKGDGERQDPQPSSMAIANGKIRLSQPEVVTLIDYNNGRFTVMNPSKGYFWSGTVDQYVGELTSVRGQSLQQKQMQIRPKGKNKDKDKDKAKDAQADQMVPKPIDLNKLPPVAIIKTGVTEKIAGYDTTKYEIRTNGDLFQEIWVAPINMSSDLNFGRYLDEQRKLSAVMLGKSAGPYNAVYRSEEYRKLLENAFVLKSITHHIAGGFERVATSIQQADVPASQFEIPDSYRRVRLSDVMNAPEEKQGS